MKLDEIFDHYIRDHKRKFSQETIATYSIAIADFAAFCNKDVTNIETDNVEDWLYKFNNDNYKATSIATKLSALKSLLNYCVEEGYIKENPAQHIESPKIEDLIPKNLQSKTIFLLREAMKENLRDSVILEVFLCSGVRVSELINFMREDYSPHERRIWVRKGKSAKEGYAYLTVRCNELLKQYLDERLDYSPYLFVTRRMRPFTRQGIYKMLKEYAARAQVSENVSPHKLRHSFASELASKGMPFYRISELLRHVNLNDSARYTKAFSKKHQNLH